MAFATFDSLYCPEEHLDLFHDHDHDQLELHRPPPLLDHDLPPLFGELRGKEEEALLADHEDGYGGVAGREAAVGWALRAVARLGFSALTAALAVAYLDRCFLGGAMQLGDRPWMSRLAAVACVALAAKVEETRVPMLLDLQLCAATAADEAYVFEAKTVRRMELLVLSALGWRMHPVTPFSYLHPLLGAGDAARLCQCEAALLAVMADCRWPRHRPSAWAAAALLATAGWCRGEDDGELLALIDAPKDEMAECAKIISEEAAAGIVIGGDNKRKRVAGLGLYSPPASPSGVIGASACFSCESSSSSIDSRFAAFAPCSASPDTPVRPVKRSTAATTTTAVPDEESRDAWPPSAYAGSG
ncbi:cyclin-D3-2-like [Oryza brachyantha]|uniref:cyclin-D3-2-like n=1 Tax=Oryza brachyantha TaxID=4533 RepID=UPI001ADA52CC|nr:cyclin-D3-2-like [Oryza brachyantha]